MCLRIIFKNLKRIFILNILLLVFYLILYKNISNFEISSKDYDLRIKKSERSIFQFDKANKVKKYSKKVLIICQSTKTKDLKNLLIPLEALRFEYKLVTIYSIKLNKNVYLSFKDRSHFSLIIFESLDVYDSIGEANKLNLLEYCKLNQIGLIFLVSDKSALKQDYLIQEHKLQINPISSQLVHECYYNQDLNGNSFFHLTKLHKNNLFIKNEVYHNINFLKLDNSFEHVIKCDSLHSLVYKAKNDITLRQVIIAFELVNMPILESLLIDSIRYSSYDRLDVSTKRYIQIDVDDIFVAATGTRMKPSDVDALLQFQNNLNRDYFNHSKENFKFNLGFSGYYYQKGNEEENKGDSYLIKNRKEFNWFDHSWAHYQAHLLNESYLKEQMQLNLNFALEHDLPTDTFYAVPPHHSGVYPVNNLFYKHWSEIWKIKATSTEGYPHLKPYYLRRGFIHNGIMVLPRQTCGIFTHTMNFTSYPNGIDKLVEMIDGGEIFRTILFKQVLVYMTHFTNYASDRLALFVFKNLFDYVSKWTNIRVETLAPIELAKKYFELYKEDSEPVWTNVCEDKRHLAIWSLNKTDYCTRFPKMIVLGPQKTGSTALYTYLNLHPNLKSNKQLSDTFEETQFFTDKNYHNGLDWYLNLFELSDNKTILFEKSANYFNEPKAPIRIQSLLNDVKLLILTINPINRAYSWYQHQRFHNNTIAIKYSFYDVLLLRTKNETELTQMKFLRNKCLDPGLYSKHLKNWLKHFSSKQLVLVDGDLLKTKPYDCLNNLQKELSFSVKIDYKKMLKFSQKKGFYCSYLNNRTKCLGQSKGRHYALLDHNSSKYLYNFYKNPNRDLYLLLKKHSFNIPVWLKENLNLLSK